VLSPLSSRTFMTTSLIVSLNRLALHELPITDYELKPQSGSRPTLLSGWRCLPTRRPRVSRLLRRRMQKLLASATRSIGRSTLPRTWATQLAFACVLDRSPISIMSADVFLSKVAWRNRRGQAHYQSPNICLSQVIPRKAPDQGSNSPRQHRSRCPRRSSCHWAASCRNP